MTQDEIKEIEFFDRAARSIYPFPDAGYHAFIINIILNFYNINLSGRMLECGCGTGEIGKYLSKRYPSLNVEGVDISKEIINKNCETPQKGYSCRRGNLENKRLFVKESFDSILCVGFLHHFQYLDLLFDNFSFWIKPDGLIFIKEPNGDNPINKLSNFLRNIIGKNRCFKYGWSSFNESNHPLSFYLEAVKKSGFSNPFIIKSIQDSSRFNLWFDFRQLLFNLMIFFAPNAFNTRNNFFMVIRKQRHE